MVAEVAQRHAAGEPVTVLAIAEATGVPRSWLYQHRELIDHVHLSRRSDTPPPPPAPPDAATDTASSPPGSTSGSAASSAPTPGASTSFVTGAGAGLAETLGARRAGCVS